MKTHAINPPEEYLETADTLSEALPYLRAFAGEVFVVKYGGNAMGGDESFLQFARDVVLLKQVGIHPVVVHGGGPQIGKMLERLAIESRFVDGLRVTDAATVEVVEMVLSGTLNKQIVTAIQQAGGTAVGLSGKDSMLIEARKLSHKSLDLGFVGEPARINTGVLETLINSRVIPVIAPVGVDASGQTYNINADTAAGAIAAALKARKLMILTDVPGVLGEDKTLISELSVQEAEKLIAGKTITGGMIPKVETCLMALKGGTQAAHILDGRLPHVLLLEIFTNYGAGTMLTAK